MKCVWVEYGCYDTELYNNYSLLGTYPLTVNMVPMLMNVTEGGNYSFVCSANPHDNINITFDVMISNNKDIKNR